MGNANSDQRWYALQVQPRLGVAIRDTLAIKKVECIHATYKQSRQWCDRVVVRELPLFPGYLFARFDLQQRWPILTTPGVKGIVSFGGAPAPIPMGEIESVRVALKSKLTLERHTVPTVGQPVAIVSGKLAGIKGIVMDVRKGWRVIISVPLINHSFRIEAPYDTISPLDVTPTNVFKSSASAQSQDGLK